MVHGQYMVGKRGGGSPISTVDRRHRLIQQVINRRTSAKTELARGTHPAVAHVNIVAPEHLPARRNELARFRRQGDGPGCSERL
jgi:hypothetical protein